MRRRLRFFAAPLTDDPFELLLAVMCLLAGLPLALGGAPPPASVQLLLPGWLVRTWGGFLLLGGALVLAGALLRSRSLAVELAGLALLGPAALAYAACILAVGGLRGLPAGAITGAFGLACYAQRLKLRRTGRLVRRYGGRRGA